jgi:ferredoxin
MNSSKNIVKKEGVTLSRPLWHRKVIVKIWPARHFLARMTKWPFFGWLIKRLLFEGDHLTFLPSEEAVSRNEKVALPGVVVDHFIERASYRFIMDACICRDASNCQNYPIDIGCMFIGEAARGINPGLGREVSIEEAKKLQRRSEKAGLINLVGKNRLDKIWLGVEPVERLLTVCHCCECCCLWKLLMVASNSIADMVHKLDGVEVTVNEGCTGCGECMPFCFVEAISVENGRASIDEKMCRGCGRCVLNCPREAIELTFKHSDYFQKCLELIGKVEEKVDVS